MSSDIFDRSFRQDGTVALVTGAASGIGLATATMLASAGATVVLTDLARAEPDGAAKGLRHEGLDVEGRGCDAAALDDLTETVGSVLDSYGRIDTVVCNAGAALDTGPHLTSTDEQLDTMVDLHMRGPLRLANLAIPAMAERGGGSFVVVSSLAGLRGNSALGLYGMTKAANAQLARNLAVQWGLRNVRANAVAPGVIETPFADPIIMAPELRGPRLERTPLRRFGTPEEVAGAIVWLTSSAGAFVTGQTIVVDGGTLIDD